MTWTQALSLLLLLACLVLAVWRRMNIGVLALGATFVLTAVTEVSASVVYKEFPGNIVVLIVGVSLLFAHCERSGLMIGIVGWVFARLGGYRRLLPWAGFFLGAAMSTMGAFSTAPIVLLVPMMAYLAKRFPGSYYINVLATVVGANVAGLSPLNPTGALVHTIAAEHHASYPRWGLWAISVVAGVCVVAVSQFIDTALVRRGSAPIDATEVPGTAAGSAGRWYRLASAAALIALVVLVVLVVGFGTDVGFTAMAMAAVLQIIFRPNESEIFGRVPWSSVLLLAGLLVYLGLLEHIGTMTSIQSALNHVGGGAALILALAYITAILCCIESSTLGVIGLMMPLAMTSFVGTPALFAVVASVAVSGALLVMNPIHVAGTLIVSYSAEAQRARVFNRLLVVTATICVVVPGILSVYPILAL